jgi:hypothetical protein
LGRFWPVRRLPFPVVHRRRSRLDSRALFSQDQNTTTRRPPKPEVIRPSRFSLHWTAATATGHGGRAERAGRRHRGLLAGARARRRGSAPPSSRPWTESCSRAPRARSRHPGAATPASRAPAAAVARRLGRSRALSSLGLGFAVWFRSKSFFSIFIAFDSWTNPTFPISIYTCVGNWYHCDHSGITQCTNQAGFPLTFLFLSTKES